MNNSLSLFPLKMTKIVLPGMAERKRGAILNISSGSALTPTPLLTLYSATKVILKTYGIVIHKWFCHLGPRDNKNNGSYINRIPTETGKPGNQEKRKLSWKSHGI